VEVALCSFPSIPEIISRIDSSGININAVTLIFLYRSDPLLINATKRTGPCEFRISNRPFQSFYLTKQEKSVHPMDETDTFTQN